MIPISYNFRSLFVRTATTVATALGIALVVFVLAAAMMLSKGVKKTLLAGGRDDNAIVIRKGSATELASSIESKVVSLILATPGVKKDETGAPLGSGETVIVIALDKIGATDGQISNVLVRGVADNVMKVRPEVKIVEGVPARPGTDEVVIGRGLVGAFKGMGVGESFDLKKNRPLKVVGVFEAQGSSFESEVWAGIETVRSSFGREGLVSSVTVRLESAEKLDAFRTIVETDKQLQLDAKRETAYYEEQSEGTSIFVQALGYAIAFFFSIGAMIGATITMHAAVAQRTREVGTLRALGFSKLTILFSFLLESCILAVLGGAVGLVFASLLGFAHISMMNFATWQEIRFSFDPTPQVMLTALLVGGLMGVLGGFFPALRAARVSPIEAMRG